MTWRERSRQTTIIWVVLLSVICVGLYYWSAPEMEVGQFKPRIPSELPLDAIWIDAPALPFTFAHGWWLGCEKVSPEADRCVLIRHNDRMSGGDASNDLESEERYISCRSGAAIETGDLRLAVPPDSMNMWILKKGPETKWNGASPAVFLQSGDVLVPVGYLERCKGLLKSNNRRSTSP